VSSATGARAAGLKLQQKSKKIGEEHTANCKVVAGLFGFTNSNCGVGDGSKT
jgi:hypothetical protein